MFESNKTETEIESRKWKKRGEWGERGGGGVRREWKRERGGRGGITITPFSFNDNLSDTLHS